MTALESIKMGTCCIHASVISEEQYSGNCRELGLRKTIDPEGGNAVNVIGVTRQTLDTVTIQIPF